MARKKKVSTSLYNLARTLNKIATTINDTETLLSGDMKKIKKRGKRKLIGKALNKINRNIIDKL